MKLKFSLSALFLCLLAFSQISQGDPHPDPWKPSEMISAETFAAEIKTADQSRHILYVGFPILYKGAHIKDAKFTGPCSKKEGLDLLAEELKNVPHTAEVVVYCGCCPFVRCPNIRPAYQALKEMGYTNIKVLELPTNLHTDWVEKNYPTESQTK